MARVMALILLAAAVTTAAATDVLSVRPSLSEAVNWCAAYLRLKPEEARALTTQKAVAIGLPSKAGEEVAGAGAVIADANATTLVAAYHSLAFLLQNPTVSAAGKFSAVPTLNDLSNLNLETKDLYALLKCRLGDCDVKLSAAEIAQMQTLTGPARVLSAALRTRLAAEYKKILLARVKSYLTTGDAAFGSYADKSDVVNAHTAYTGLVRQQTEAATNCTHLGALLASNAANGAPETESFIYWAKQKFGDSKPVINLVQVLIHRDGGRTFIASKQLYASHYTEAGLMVAELVPFGDAPARPQTLVVNTVRLRLDVLGGAFGFVKRRAAQPRLLEALKESLDWMRLNLTKPEVQPGVQAGAQKVATS